MVAWKGLVLATLVAMTVATVVVNAVVLLALTFGRQRPCPMSFAMTLIVSMVTADMLISVTVMPLAVYGNIGDTWELGDIVCKLYSGADIILCTASIWHLTGLACDRYLAIHTPFFHRRLTASSARVTCVVLWLASLLIGTGLVLEPWQGETSSKLVVSVTGNNCAVLQTPAYVVASALLSFFLPLLFIVAFHIAIVISLRSSKGMQVTERDVKRTNDVKRNGRDENSGKRHEGNDDIEGPAVSRRDITERNAGHSKSGNRDSVRIGDESRNPDDGIEENQISLFTLSTKKTSGMERNTLADSNIEPDYSKSFDED